MDVKTIKSLQGIWNGNDFAEINEIAAWDGMEVPRVIKFLNSSLLVSSMGDKDSDGSKLKPHEMMHNSEFVTKLMGEIGLQNTLNYF